MHWHVSISNGKYAITLELCCVRRFSSSELALNFFCIWLILFFYPALLPIFAVCCNPYLLLHFFHPCSSLAVSLLRTVLGSFIFIKRFLCLANTRSMGFHLSVCLPVRSRRKYDRFLLLNVLSPISAIQIDIFPHLPTFSCDWLGRNTIGAPKNIATSTRPRTHSHAQWYWKFFNKFLYEPSVPRHRRLYRMCVSFFPYSLFPLQ